MTVQATTCSTEAQVWKIIRRHVAELVKANKVIDTKWKGKPLLVTPVPHGKHVTYDPARVERVIATMSQFDQIKGRWSGKPLAMFDWQVIWEIAPVFGLVTWEDHENSSLFDEDEPRDEQNAGQWVRIIRTAWFEKPRKNGKSTECSGLGLYLAFADNEDGAEVYAAARNRDQAKIVFTPARVMAERCGPLRRKLGPTGITKNLLENPSTLSIFRPLASDLGGGLHGLNVSGAVIDEVHVHKTSDTIDAIETGTGSRLQPLIVFITTADEGIPGSIYDTKRTYIDLLASRHQTDESFYAVVFGATKAQMTGKRAFSDATLIAANPGIGYTVTMRYLRSKAREAAGSPKQLNKFLRLHLGKRTKQSVAWFDLDQWDAAMGAVKDSEFRGKKGYLGIDLSATTDFTAAAILVPDEKTGGIFGKLMVWIPEDRVDHLERLTKVPLRQWAKEGFIRFTEGNVVDYAQFRRDLNAEVARLKVTIVETGYDPWNATETVQEMQSKKPNYTMIPIRQGYGSLSAPSKELDRLVNGSTPEKPLVRFGWNPVLRWMADCVETMTDNSDNIKPKKPDRRESAARIDGIAAIVTGLARLIVRPRRRKAASSTA